VHPLIYNFLCKHGACIIDDDDEWEDMEEEQVDTGMDNGQTATMVRCSVLYIWLLVISLLQQDGNIEHLQTVAKLFVEQQIPQKVILSCSIIAMLS